MKFTFNHKFHAVLNGESVTIPDQVGAPGLNFPKEFPVIKTNGERITIVATFERVRNAEEKNG